jgi:hypothetical protein
MRVLYTSAPWRVAPLSGPFGRRIVRDLEDGMIFDVAKVYGNTSNTATEANARLVAAAPELLEALIAAADALSLGKEYQGNVLEVVAAARDAITKARMPAIPARKRKRAGAA